MSDERGLLFVDLSQLTKSLEDFGQELTDKLHLAAKTLTIQAEAHVREQASTRLNSRREAFLENLEWEQIDEGTYAVVIQKDGLWIEDGQQQHEMLSDLLASPKAKTAKDGSRYLIIPFKHSKGKTQQTPQQRQLLAAVKSELRKQKISYKGIERNGDGSPKLGVLHKLNIANPKQSRPGIGDEGPVGMPFTKHPAGGGQAGPGGRPFLWGAQVIQSTMKDKNGAIIKDDNGHPKAERNTFTFRVASSKQAGSGAWMHPGNAPMHFLEETEKWALDQFNNNIMPDILKGLGL